VARKGRIWSQSKRPVSNLNLTINEIIAALSTLSQHLTPRILNQLTVIAEAVLAMTGRVTMLARLVPLGLKGWDLSDGKAFFWRKINMAAPEKVE